MRRHSRGTMLVLLTVAPRLIVIARLSFIPRSTQSAVAAFPTENVKCLVAKQLRDQSRYKGFVTRSKCAQRTSLFSAFLLGPPSNDCVCMPFASTDAADDANGFPMPPSTFYGVSQVIPFGGPELISCGIDAHFVRGLFGLPT
ncbi:hypothetical protein BDZ89DRAFT_409018 [Hymenopellis radicata]|nr:hypothetical protein BDZ89DRAFT_409018 [Hymenopellis radicata]